MNPEVTMASERLPAAADAAIVAVKARDVARVAAEVAALAPGRSGDTTAAGVRGTSPEPLARATQFIRDNPLTALLVGVALGLLLAELAR
jgi:hypothetical protein